MEEVYNRIVEKGDIPTRGDIQALLASIGQPGEAQEAKQLTVRQLFDEIGHHGRNFQGHHVADHLEIYAEY